MSVALSDLVYGGGVGDGCEGSSDGMGLRSARPSYLLVNGRDAGIGWRTIIWAKVCRRNRFGVRQTQASGCFVGGVITGVAVAGGIAAWAGGDGRRERCCA